MADGGWIKLYRKTRQSFVWTDPNLLKLWLLLLIKASHSDSKFLFNGQEISVTSGQLVTGAHVLASEMNEGVPRDKAVTWRSVWRWVKKFENAEMLTIKSTSQYSVITITNFNNYQSSDKRVTSDCQSTDNQVTTYKNLKNEKNEKNINHSSASAEPHVDFDKLFEYLNEKSGKHFKNTATNRKLVHERLREGFTPKDIQTAIDNVTAGWLGTEMEQYIRPSTIFRASKFEGYVNSVPRVAKPQQSGGRPRRQEATPEWMQEGYQPPKQEVSADAKAELAEQLKELEQLRSRNATSS
ncbi:conserved phage C-terminal domain-containing protein [Lacticaseibacillus suibinensis]|uniref:conserved phage C-terminal domain-containing protein n=1 Tax=Lacticaseibacillus suibinensis TaxID=2486011 RepID=UPI001940D5A6|nr:conserved phage C-terminal domain-containing protein [Lacticaseibacillus suibinensis]